ncbi:nuclear transport factor 2 family protein [Arcanobacterium buesumense]|uniref:SnoaL-like domain-containing protein n=1 Tax=Arcanobacterium buesumense TaxID=2722751 RepID=A0A6H2ELU7_9ACTO|nr:nuclear transport factor 2 family protein [Arcanobacterium buesumense]QJC22046.1 SnoaL-like domain-containing protein [Arcanobacterium buesumense]
MNTENMEVFNSYAEALARGDFDTAFELMSDDVVWHMGGESPLSGVTVGKQSLADRLAEFARMSNGTFRVITNWAASNDDFVATSVVSLAERGKEKLNDPGIDLFRIADRKIQEVWTFAERQEEEDQFWQNCGTTEEQQ